MVKTTVEFVPDELARGRAIPANVRHPELEPMILHPLHHLSKARIPGDLSSFHPQLLRGLHHLPRFSLPSSTDRNVVDARDLSECPDQAYACAAGAVASLSRRGHRRPARRSPRASTAQPAASSDARLDSLLDEDALPREPRCVPMLEMLLKQIFSAGEVRRWTGSTASQFSNFRTMPSRFVPTARRQLSKTAFRSASSSLIAASMGTSQLTLSMSPLPREGSNTRDLDTLRNAPYRTPRAGRARPSAPTRQFQPFRSSRRTGFEWLPEL
jgi:hypothetical protein